MYVATVGLSSCGGCHSALFTIGEPLIALLCDHNIAFSTYMVDQRSISPADVVLVEGGIRNRDESELAGEIARNARKVVAVGSCAVFGGVNGMGKRAATAAERGRDLPPLLQEMKPLDSCAPVELYVPGCPPPPNLILEALRSALDGTSPAHFDGTVCSECPRRAERERLGSWSPHPGPGVPQDRCLLNSGLLCLGPVTRGGCHSSCPARGTVCIGCRGPSDAVQSSQLHSIFGDMVKHVSLTARVKEEKAAALLKSMLKTIYLFTGSDPVTRSRVGEKTGGWN
jgi:F420-non-reducing hydrogenase small subunit